MNKKDWNDPYFKYKLPKRGIVIDVTASIPRFENEIDGLSDVVAEFDKRKFNKVCDFGAGKLRNCLYLLKKGFKVWAVEFEEAFDTPIAQKRREKALGYKGFFELKYPKEFLNFSEMFDAVIIVNVVNIVPEERHRKKILNECADRLKSGGLLLWMTQYGEPNYKPGATNRLRLNDGWCYNLHLKYQTFNRDYTPEQIKSFVPSSKYKLVGPITSNHHRAFLFERT